MQFCSKTPRDQESRKEVTSVSVVGVKGELGQLRSLTQIQSMNWLKETSTKRKFRNLSFFYRKFIAEDKANSKKLQRLL